MRMRFRATVCTLAALLLSIGQSAVAIDKEVLVRVRAKISAGQALIDKGLYSDAEEVFRAAVDAEPMVPTAHLGLAAALAGQGRFEEALPVLAETERRFIDWEQMIGLAELQKRQLAERQLQSLIDLAAAEGGTGQEVSVAGVPRDLRQLNEDKISKEQFLFREKRELEGIEAIPAQVFYLEGISYLRTGRPLLGIEALEVCLLVDSGHGLGHYNLAVALFGQGEIGEAREHLRLAVEAGVEPHPQFVADLEAADG